MVFTEAEQAEIENSGGRVVRKKQPDPVAVPSRKDDPQVSEVIDILKRIEQKESQDVKKKRSLKVSITKRDDEGRVAEMVVESIEE